MRTLVAAGLLVALAVLTAPVVSANPDITDPYCTGGQTPLFGECKVAPNDPNLETSGLDPDVGSSLDPESMPAI